MNEQSYRIVTYLDPPNKPKAGIIVDGRLLDVAAALAQTAPEIANPNLHTVLGLLGQWGDVQPQFQNIAYLSRRGDHFPSMPLDTIKLSAPILYPNSIYFPSIGRPLRLVKGTLESILDKPSAKQTDLTSSHIMHPTPGTLIGTGGQICGKWRSKFIFLEAYFAFVIGRPCYYVRPHDALAHVAFVTIMKSVRQRDPREPTIIPSEARPLTGGLSRQTSDRTVALGPWLIPLEAVEYFGAFRIRVWINHRLIENSVRLNASVDAASRISELSKQGILQPGDIVAIEAVNDGSEGHPLVVRGDQTSVWIENIGLLVNDVEE